MKRILSLVASLGLVFGLNGHRIEEYLLAATPGTAYTSDETLVRMLSDDSGLNNVAIVEAVLLAKGGFEYQDVLDMSFADKQAKLQESLGAGSPLPPSTDLVVFGDGAGAGDSSSGYAAPMPVFVEPAPVYASSLPADWGNVVTDTGNVAQVEAFLFNLSGDYEVLNNKDFDNKLAQYLSAVGASPVSAAEEEVVVPAPVELVEEISLPAPTPAPAPAPVASAAAATSGSGVRPAMPFGGGDLLVGAANLRKLKPAAVPAPTPAVSTPAPVASAAAAGAVARTGERPNMIDILAPGARLKLRSASDMVLNQVVPTPAAPAAPAPAPAPAVGARQNMSLALAQIAGGGQALKPADGVFTKGGKAASEAVQAQLKDFVKKTGELQALLTSRSVDKFTSDITSKLNYYIAVADYIKSARNQSGFELADEAVKVWISNTYLTLKSLVEKNTLDYAAAVQFGHNKIGLPEVAQSGKLIVEEEEEDFDSDEEEDEVVVIENRLPNWMAIPFKAEYDRQKATPPAVSGGGMGAPAPMPMPLPAPRPGGMGAPTPMPMPLPAATGAATGSPRPNLPPRPAGPKPAASNVAPAPIVTTSPALAASAASSGSVSPSGITDEAKLLIRDGLMVDENLVGDDVDLFNGFVANWLSTGVQAGFDVPSKVLSYDKLSKTLNNLQRAKARFLIAIGQTSGVTSANIASWKTKLGLA